MPMTAWSTLITISWAHDFPPLGYRIDWILTLDGAQRWQTHTCEIIRTKPRRCTPAIITRCWLKVELLRLRRESTQDVILCYNDTYER